MMNRTYRAWINQPSKLQQLHSLHGMLCIVQDFGDSRYVKLWFTDGPVHSMQAPRLSVSEFKLSDVSNGRTNRRM